LIVNTTSREISPFKKKYSALSTSIISLPPDFFSQPLSSQSRTMNAAPRSSDRDRLACVVARNIRNQNRNLQAKGQREHTAVREQSNHQRLVALNFRIPLDLRRRLKVIAASRSVTMTNLLLELLERFDREEQKLAKKD
jgi:hypothetical protein